MPLNKGVRVWRYRSLARRISTDVFPKIELSGFFGIDKNTYYIDKKNQKNNGLHVKNAFKLGFEYMTYW